MKRAITLFAMILSLLLGVVSFAQDSAKQDMKDAGHATKKTAKKAGHKVKKGTHQASQETKEGAQKVENKTTPQ